jgi:hypothetical protein
MRFLEKNVPLVGAHRNAPLQEILNRLGHLFPGNGLNPINSVILYPNLIPFSELLPNLIEVSSPKSKSTFGGDVQGNGDVHGNIDNGL